MLELKEGNDWFHTQRVFNNAQLIAKNEAVDLFVVSLGALLHDIADSKFHDGNEIIGPQIASEFLQSLAIKKKIITHIVKIIEHVSFKGGNHTQQFTSHGTGGDPGCRSVRC